MKRRETVELCVPMSGSRQHRHKSLGFVVKREACEVLWGMHGMEGKDTVHVVVVGVIRVYDRCDVHWEGRGNGEWR